VSTHLQLSSHTLDLRIANIRTVQEGKKEQNSQSGRASEHILSLPSIQTYGGKILRSIFRSNFFSATGSIKIAVSEPFPSTNSKCSIECFLDVSVIFAIDPTEREVLGKEGLAEGCCPYTVIYMISITTSRMYLHVLWVCTISIWGIRG